MTIQVAFPKHDEGSTALVVPRAPITPANTGLEAYVAQPVEQARQQLVCKNLLVDDTLVAAETEARKLYAEMLNNTQVFMTYGTQALEGVNALVDRLLHEVEPTKIPELTTLMKDLNAEMRGVKNKYDVSDPKVRKKYSDWKGGIGRFFGRARTLIELLMEDVQSIETQIDKVARTLRDRQYMLIRNVTYYDELYNENEAEILKLIYVIGVMELIRDLAAADAAAVQVGNAALSDRGGERQATLSQFASNMEIKIAEYKGRLFVAWSTSPQVRMMRTLNVGLAERINELICVTIPTMRATILQWRMLVQTEDAAKMSAVVQAASNEWLQAYAAAGATVVPRIAEVVETPTLTPQTVAAMAESIQAQADGIVAAMEHGAQRRKELDEAIMAAKGILDNSARTVSDALIERVVGAATKPLELEVRASIQ